MFGQIAKEAFDHVQPGGAGRREVHVEARVPRQPALHLRMFVRGIIVGNDVKLFARRRGIVYY